MRGLLAALILALGSPPAAGETPMEALASARLRALEHAGFSRAELPGSQLVYWRAGEGPTLVLLHGAGDRAATWSGVAPRLLAGRRLLVPDLPGHGESGPREGPIRFAALVAGLDALLACEAPEGKVTLVGNSMGAWLASVWAAAHPDRVERLVFVNGGPILGESRANLFPQDREEARRLMALLRAPSSPAVPDPVLDDVVRLAKVGPMPRLVAGGDMLAFLLEGRLDALSVPVELLWGEADQVVPLSYAEKLLRLLPRARLTPVPLCGHVPQLECPDRFGEMLAEVLR